MVANYRQQRGEAIAEACKIEKQGDQWIVPSQSGNGKYSVRLNLGIPTCSCPDFELREMPCKHIFAVTCTMTREYSRDGTTTTTRSVTVSETVKKPTYPQNWTAYNKAQTNEKDKLQVLLAGLCRTIKDDTPPRKGQPRIQLSDAIFACVLKVYSGFSGRRFMSDLREAQERGHVSRTIHYNSIFNYLDNPHVTEILRTLITETSRPLKAVELDFACDSSGFMTSRFIRWFDQKHGVPRKQAEWVKAHIMCGTKTNCVTAVEIHDKHAADVSQLPTLVNTTAATFTLREVSADKGYVSGENHEVIAKHGATPYIAFKGCATGAAGGMFQTMFHFFSMHRQLFLNHYHKRSNVESTFSMIKAKFGDSVRSKTDVAMKNEVLAKMVCHNIVCVIHELYEAGLEPQFWGQVVPEAKGLDRKTLPNST